ncbi:MAG TPA: hypothetical protein VND91_07760 [Candidatus Saccharimonadia bacterium]|nr:hypothetical protein [Candidatus Saccharimonadia bacterium]
MLIPRVSSFGLILAAGFAATLAHGANLVVTTTADAGPGSLRDAINTANGNGEADTITFAPALADQTIAPTTALPLLQTPQITIDGDLDDDCVPDINLSGASVVPPGLQAGLGISNLGSGAIVRGLAIHSFANVAISLGSTASGATLSCNHFGTNTLGVESLPNGTTTLGHISVGTSGHTIGPGNLVANSRGVGLRVVESALLPTSDFDFVGLPSDSAPRVYANLSFNDNCSAWVGDGFTPLDGNGRPFRDNFGMRLRGRITVGATGNYDFNFAGIDDQARLKVDGAVVGAPVITGMSATRSAALTAGPHTIEIAFREAAGAARLTPAISGPGSVALTSDDQSFCAPPSQPGLCAELFQLRIPSTGNRITRNRFRDNAGAGIALGLCTNTNDVGDADTGPNELMNSPVITGIANGAGGELLVTGTAPANSTVELFQAAIDPSGFGEGDAFLGQATASAGGNFAVSASAAPGGAVTATATNAGNNTSEFGRNFAYSTGATGLYAKALSTTSIELAWKDPNLGETGFRIERSADGASFTPAATLGANATSHVDGTLAPNTLYHYRVVATRPAGDAPASNRATASTFPATAAKVCFDRIPRDVAFTTGPSVAFDGTAWGVAYAERAAGRDNLDLKFQRYEPTTLAPLGPQVTISDADMNASGARLVFNGQRYGALWTEFMRGAAGEPASGAQNFALLEADGTIVRRGVRVSFPRPLLSITQLAWDGTHWGVFGIVSTTDTAVAALGDIMFVRMTEQGTALGPAIPLAATADLSESRVAVEWSAQRGQYGIAFVRGRNNDYQWLFQRFTASGTPVDANPVVLDAVSFAAGEFGLASLDVAYDGSDWAIAYARDDPSNEVETAVFLRRVDGDSGTLLGPATRLSDDAADASDLSFLMTKPGGGFAAFTRSSGLNFVVQLARMQATAAGARDGTRIFVTPDDGQSRGFANVAANGSEFLAVYGINGGTLPSEIFAVRIAADGATPPQAPVALTSGHPAADIPRNPQHVANLSDGFVAVWVDGAGNALRINARIYNGTGQAVSSLTPLTSTSTRGVLGLASVGNSFALAWKNAASDVIFARYNASGGTLVAERTIAAATGAGAPVALGWDGESYGLFWVSSTGSRFQRVAPDGTAIGNSVVVPRGPDGSGQVAWLGDGWALTTRSASQIGDIDYIRIDPTGVLLDGPVQVTSGFGGAPRTAQAHRMHFDGRNLGLIWSQWKGFDPPSEDIQFTVLERDGSKAFAEVPVVASGFSDTQARIYPVGASFRVLANGGGFGSGLREVDVTPLGVVLPGARFVSNRPSAIGPAAVAHNGATTGIFSFPSDTQHLHFHTEACLADASPPPCPVLTAQLANGEIQTSWGAVSDAESSVIRYHLYRDSEQLAEVDADQLAFTDRGWERGATHAYELRALNGAFRESAACAVVQVGTDAIFANGYE